jgi:hypothetical protein
MANVFEYKQVWTDDFQKSNWAVPIYPVIADLQFTAGLKVGDTVNRRYRNKAIFAKDLTSSGGYSVQDYGEAKETFTISKQKEASVRIVDTEVLHTDLNTTKSYGAQMSNAIFNEIDGDTLNAARAGAGQTIDNGTLGGTAGDGIQLSIANIADIPVIAMEKLMGTNVVMNPNLRFGKIAYDDYGGMLSMIIPPQAWTVIQKYFMARGTPLGDQTTANGYRGEFFGWQVFVSNNLPFTARLVLSTNPTDGDTITIKGVTLTFKSTVDAGVTAGQVKIASTAALTVANLVAFLNAPTTTVADSTNAGYNSIGASTVSENGLTINKSDAIHGLVATNATTAVTIVMKGTGKVTVSASMTAAVNTWTTAKQQVHGLFMVAKNVSLAIRKDPNIKDNPVSNSIATDYIMWTVYDNKVFIDQARAIIDFVIDCSATSFAAYSNVHA